MSPPGGTPTSRQPSRNRGQRAGPARSRRPPGPEEPPAEAGTLFSDAEIGAAVPGAAVSLGAQVVASPLYAAQRAYVRKAPAEAEVAAVIDALGHAGGKLPVTLLATVAGQPPFRMSGYLAQIGRLLNVDGYPVISVGDEGRTAELNAALLREQFLGGSG